MTTTDNLDELLRLHGDATPGTWHVNDFDDAADEVERYQVQTDHRPKGSFGGLVLGAFDAEEMLPRQAQANAEFCAAAHNALPGLIERVRRAEAAVETLRADASASFAKVGDIEVRNTRDACKLEAIIAERDALREVARLSQRVASEDWSELLESCDPEAHPEEIVENFTNLRAALAKVPR